MTRRRDLLIGGGLAVAAGMVRPPVAGAASLDRGGLEARIDAWRARGFVDGAILVARAGRPMFREAFGFADRERAAPSRVGAAFRIGSITKSFTAAAILMLAQDGGLSLDDPIRRTFPEAPAIWTEITLRHLLTHTSGIVNFTRLPGWEDRHWVGKSVEDLIALVRDEPLESVPGMRVSYDNTGYVLLGGAVARVSGRPLGEVLDSRIFRPLAMRHTGFAGDRGLAGRASGAVHEGSAWRATTWMSNIRESGAGALYSTVDDLLRWDRALHEGRLLSPASQALMFADHGGGFGFGWVLSVQDGRRVWWHNGHVEGYGAMIARYPDDGLTIIILSNDDDAPVEALSRDIAAFLMKTRGLATP